MVWTVICFLSSQPYNVERGKEPPVSNFYRLFGSIKEKVSRSQTIDIPASVYKSSSAGNSLRSHPQRMQLKPNRNYERILQLTFASSLLERRRCNHTLVQVPSVGRIGPLPSVGSWTRRP